MIRILFMCAVAFLLLAVLVALMTFGARWDCARLVSDGYSVVQIESGCYADVGGGMYIPVYVHERPKPIAQIILEIELKKNKSILSFP